MSFVFKCRIPFPVHSLSALCLLRVDTKREELCKCTADLCAKRMLIDLYA